MAVRPIEAVKRINTLRVELGHLKTRLSLENLHEAILRDLYVNPEDILSAEADSYYKSCYIKCATKQIADRALELSGGQIMYIYENERTILPVSLELSETTVVAIWNIPLEAQDDFIRRVFSNFGSVSRVSKIFFPASAVLPNIYSGKRLIHFFELTAAIPQYMTIYNFKIRTRVQRTEGPHQEAAGDTQRRNEEPNLPKEQQHRERSYVFNYETFPTLTKGRQQITEEKKQ